MRLYGLIGRSLRHSWSADMFNDKFLREGIDARYDLYPMEDISLLPDLLASRQCLAGLNVTIPYKESVIGYLDSLSEEAGIIGAVNTIRIERRSDGAVRLEGHNTDAGGFYDALSDLLQHHEKEMPGMALLLGTGGASKAVRYALTKLGVDVTTVSRTASHGCITYGELDKRLMSECRLIVNATPAGMFPDCGSCPDIPYHLIGKEHVCFDLVYNPAETMFMKLSEARGALCCNGLGMLRGQAMRAWHIWQGSADGADT